MSEPSNALGAPETLRRHLCCCCFVSGVFGVGVACLRGRFRWARGAQPAESWPPSLHWLALCCDWFAFPSLLLLRCCFPLGPWSSLLSSACPVTFRLLPLRGCFVLCLFVFVFRLVCLLVFLELQFDFLIVVLVSEYLNTFVCCLLF